MLQNILRTLTSAIYCSLHPLVKENERDSFENFMKERILSYSEHVHMSTYGNLDRWNPVGNFECITRPIAVGVYECSPERDHYWPQIGYSPPQLNAISFLYDANNVPLYKYIIEAVAKTVPRDVLFTQVVEGYQTQGSGIDEEEHNAMHSLREGDKSVFGFPHSIIGIAVRKDPNDDSSEIVAAHGASFAWDTALRNLLPENVRGIQVVLHNSCK